MFFDPLYVAVMVTGLLLSLGAQVWLRSALSRSETVQSRRGLRGAEVAQAILRVRGLGDVRIEEAEGFLSDHYDPSTKTLRLSPRIFQGTSIAAAGIAAHEVGHAIQDADGYAPMRIRQALVPVANVGTNLGVLLVIIGMAIGIAGLAKAGVVLFAVFVAFTIITLPVEIDASKRAKRLLAQTHLLGDDELVGVERVLRAAAATYVAAALTAAMQLVYFVLRIRDRRL